jgi:hypothetical protein
VLTVHFFCDFAIAVQIFPLVETYCRENPTDKFINGLSLSLRDMTPVDWNDKEYTDKEISVPLLIERKKKIKHPNPISVCLSPLPKLLLIFIKIRLPEGICSDYRPHFSNERGGVLYFQGQVKYASIRESNSGYVPERKKPPDLDSYLSDAYGKAGEYPVLLRKLRLYIYVLWGNL